MTLSTLAVKDQRQHSIDIAANLRYKARRFRFTSLHLPFWMTKL